MAVRTVGILSTGDMGAAIGNVLRHGGLDVATSLAGRSELTTLRATEAGIRDAGSVDALVAQSDLLLSVLVPSEATGVAEAIAGAFSRTAARPPVVECNAIAPQTVVRIAALLGDAGGAVIDAGIIGGPPRPGHGGTHIYCSGPETALFEELGEHGLDVRRIGPDIGQASGLKMVYAASTKGTTAVWTELLVAAEALGLSEVLLAEFGDAQLPRQLMDGVPTMPRRARRWTGEMEEIARTFADLGLTPRIFEGAADIYRLVGETALADQTSREPDPELSAMLDVLARKLRE